MRTVDAILDAVAVAEGHDESWKDERRTWVHTALAHDGDLRSTPLTIVSITLLAVTSGDSKDLPTERAHVLRQVLVNVLERDVSVREGDLPSIGALEGTEAKYALEDALRVVAEPVLTGAPRVEVAKSTVAAVLSKLFGLPLRRAEAVADDALSFWKRLGVLAEDDGVLVGKVRPLVEVAHGWRIAAVEPARREALIAAARAEPVLWPCLGLAAGLSRAVMAAWAAAVGVDGTADQLLSLLEARASGAELSDAELTALALTGGSRLLAQTDDAERIAEALLTVPWTPVMLAVLRPRLEIHVPAERRDIVRVLETVALDPVDSVDVDLLRRFVQAPAPPDPVRAAAPDGALAWLLAGGDVGYSRAKEAALVALATRDRVNAELALASFEDGSTDLRARLATALRSHGLDHLVNAADLELKKNRPLAWFDPDAYRELRVELLENAAALAKRTALTRREERQLEALSAVWKTSGHPLVNHNWSAERRGGLSSWLGAVTILGAQDLGVVATQAQLVLEELAADDESGEDVMADTPLTLDLDRWDLVNDPTAMLMTLMDCLGSLPREASQSWLYAVLNCPDRFAVAELIRERRPRFRIWARELLAFGSVMVAETPESEAEALLMSPDPFDRSGAAEWWSWEARSRRPLPGAIFECGTDPDRNVRASLLGYLEPRHVDDEIRALLTTMRTTERTGWRCRWCGADNPPQGGENGGCTGCRSNGPDLQALGDLLGGERPPRLPRIVHRPRRIRLPARADPLF